MKKLIGIISLLGIIVFSAALYFNGELGTHIILSRAAFSKLPDWQGDDHAAALDAFKKSCTKILKRDPTLPFSNIAYAGPTSAWQAPCRAALQLTDVTNEKAGKFFETWFQPYQLKNNYSGRGLFTGYYLPTLMISYKKDSTFNVPIYALPKDLVKIDLGKFKPELTGKSITAQVVNNTVQPYPDRTTINAAPLKNAEIIAWTNNPIDLFFAQIQGSAIGILPNKQQVTLSYAGANGRPYVAIGKVLIKINALTPNNVSMQSIREWLEQHPKDANGILNQNPSYGFFVLGKSSEVIGTENVPLTPARSVAVDNKFIPLGAPLWVSTSFPLDKETHAFDHLVIAQDTGGAIDGLVRGDIYWGAGEKAADIAGHMQSPGRLWILLPKGLS